MLWIDIKQDLLALLDFLRMCGKIGGRKDPLCRNLGDAAEATVGHLFRHHGKGFSTLRRKTSRCIAEHEFRYPFRMRERKGERNGATETVADQRCILADTEFIKAIFDHGKVGIHKREDRRLRAVEARQIEHA